MKIALVHDYLKEYGGAERVLESLHELYPDAPIFTLVYLPSYLGPHQKRFENIDIRISYLKYLPYLSKLISPIRLIAPFVFKSFDFSGYDVIITSATGAYSPNIINKKNAKLICYCHTPPRYLYGYATARQLSTNVVIKVVATIANHFLRLIDFHSSENVDQFIANSEEVASRIKKFYRKDAIVIYPPVVSENESEKVVFKGQKNYYLAGGRLARPKNIDLLVKACTELSLPLKVFGKGFAGYGEELQKLAGPSVEFLGEISDERKLEILKGAKAFLFASEDEDFGIIPVEAMAVGTPVIAYRSGGVKETVIEGKTGLFFDELSVVAVKDAIKKLDKNPISENMCRKRAYEFSMQRFKKQIVRVVKETSGLKIDKI